MSEQELIELLADKEHASWARWMEYLFSQCEEYIDADGYECMVIPYELVAHWGRQVKTPYAELSEQEKQSDRAEVAHILPIIKAYYPLEAIRDIVFDAVDKAINPPETEQPEPESPYLGGES